MTLRILVTNDDGINAPGLKVAKKIAIQLSGNPDNVITVAPATEQSGVAHSTSYIRPCLIDPIDSHNFSVEGTPTDCVLAGLTQIMKDNPPNIILSGVNKGHNIAEDTVYSGTVGAALEGSLHGIKSISLSQYYSKESLLMKDPFECANEMGSEVCKKLLDKADWSRTPYKVFFNINFPPTSAKKVLGIKVCKQGRRTHNSFGMAEVKAPNGRSFMWIDHRPGNFSVDKNSDLEACKNSFITVTPLQADLTAHDYLKKVETIFKNDLK